MFMKIDQIHYDIPFTKGKKNIRKFLPFLMTLKRKDMMDWATL